MLFHKKIDYQNNEILVYFVNESGKIQGTLKAYSLESNHEIREEFLLYSQEYKDGLPVGERVNQFYSQQIK